jgi:hypothetical protein
VAQGNRSGLTLTTLDNQSAYKLSQDAIGKPVGDLCCSTARAEPKRLADYKGKPLLVSFIYTACFQVCPTTTKNLQKAVENTVAVLGAESLQHRQHRLQPALRFARGDESVRHPARHPPAELGIPQPGACHRR